jgi:hypothetical protein
MVLSQTQVTHPSPVHPLPVPQPAPLPERDSAAPAVTKEVGANRLSKRLWTLEIHRRLELRAREALGI